MRKLLFALAALTLTASFATAADFGKSSLPPGGTSDPTLYDINATTITQSTSSTVIAGNSVACNANDGSGTTPNSYVRRFNLDGVHGIITPFTVSKVDFGIENAATPLAGIGVTVNLYTIPNASALTFANMTLIGTAAFNVAPQSLTIFSAPVVGVVATPLLSDLVVEVKSADGRTHPQGFFFIGSNNLGQTALSFLAATDCGIPNPTSTAAIGFPGMHIVMAVTGTEGATQTVDSSWGRLKTLYR
jgi:hypothetical protein